MRGMLISALGGIALIGSTAYAPALAQDEETDSVLEQIELGTELYQEQLYSDAITELQFAINEIQKLLGEALIATFPEPFENWTAQEATSEGGAAFMGGGTMLNRTYQKDNSRIEAQLIADSPMIQGFAAMAANPALLAANPNAERVRLGRDNAILTFDPNQLSGDITFVSGGRLMLKLDARKLDDKQILIDMLKSWDLRALKDILGM